jgi:branched-subunit amino acid ABC-type transport system permease component
MSNPSLKTVSSIALLALIFTFIAIPHSYFGLELLAVAKNLHTAYILGITAP